jgi:hypothetical protein
MKKKEIKKIKKQESANALNEKMPRKLALREAFKPAVKK